MVIVKVDPLSLTLASLLGHYPNYRVNNTQNMTIMGKKYFVVVLLLVWVLSMVYMVLNLGHSTGLGQSVAMDNILLELNKVKEENNKLFIQIQSFSRWMW